MALVGAGRVATAVGVLLGRAGHRVVAAAGREASRARVERHLPGTTLLPAAEAARAARIVIIGVPDDHIEETSAELAGDGAVGAGQHVIHLSGSVPLEALSAARSAGAGVLSMHPLQSFPDVETGIERLPGSGIGITAAAEPEAELGEALARDVGAVPFRLEDTVKPLYHSAAVFSANYLVAVQGLAELVMRRSGIVDPLPLLESLARTSFDRAFSMGPGTALTGPAARGDAGTIERNLEALSRDAPEAVEAYVSLAAVAARLARDAGRIDQEDVRRIEEELGRWR